MQVALHVTTFGLTGLAIKSIIACTLSSNDKAKETRVA